MDHSNRGGGGGNSGFGGGGGAPAYQKASPVTFLQTQLNQVESLLTIIRPVKETPYREATVKAGMRELKLAYTKLQEAQDWLQEAIEEEKYAEAQSK